jgi:hypothetical protein
MEGVGIKNGNLHKANNLIAISRDISIKGKFCVIENTLVSFSSSLSESSDSLLSVLTEGGSTNSSFHENSDDNVKCGLELV